MSEEEAAPSTGASLSPCEQRVVGCLAASVRFCCILYTAFLILLPTVLLPFIGERSMLFAFFLYLPPAIWLLPVVPLLLASVWRMRRLSALLVISALFFVTIGLQFQFAGGSSSGDESKQLRILTYNRGQHANQSLQPFKNAQRPDVIVFQEASRRAKNYERAEEYEEFPHVEGIGEFVILSRLPIIESRLIEPEVSLLKKPRKRPKNRPVTPESVAARHVVAFAEGQVAIYNVHFRTPRDTLNAYRRGSIAWGVLGIPFTPLAKKRQAHEEYWHKRIAQAEGLLREIAADPLPVIVAGDFNAPSGGYVHRRFASQLADAHRKGGRGYGFTFPGTTRNPLSLFGPWMRIDYVFSDSNWKTVHCEVERGRKSQHRALFAILRFTGRG